MKSFLKALSGLCAALMFFNASVWAADSHTGMSGSTQTTTEQAGEVSRRSYALDGPDDGTGIVVAVLDACFDVEDPHFYLKDAASARLSADAVAELNDELHGDGLYISPKLPYVYDYFDGDCDLGSASYGSYHGSAVAGLIGANVNPGDAVTAGDDYQGAAPACQLLFMKVFDDTGSTMDFEIICDAFEDALTLGADVINLSFGNTIGASEDSAEKDGIPERFLALIEKAQKQGVFVCSAAGNNGIVGPGSRYDQEYQISLPLTSMPDSGTVAYPATVSSFITAASSRSANVKFSCFRLGGDAIPYTDTSNTAEALDYRLAAQHWDKKTFSYIAIPGAGTEADYLAPGTDDPLDLTGKLALVSRGEITFSEKIALAKKHGAAGVIIYDNVPDNAETLRMSMADAEIPAVFISYADGQRMIEAEEKRVSFAIGDNVTIYNPAWGLISDFSSAGVTPDMKLKPDLTAVGEEVDVLGYNREILSKDGTSYSAAAISGLAARILSAGGPRDPALLKAWMMNAAVPLKDNLTVYYSPRRQGAGLIEAETAFSLLRKGCLMLSADGNAAIETGDHLDSSFPLTFTIANPTDTEKTIRLSAAVLSNDYESYAIRDGEAKISYYKLDKTHQKDGLTFFAKGNDQTVGSASVRRANASALSNVNLYAEDFEEDTLILAPGETLTLTYTVTLDRTWLREQSSLFPSGFFIEGYLFADDGEGTVSSIPFIGFRGSWSAGRVFDNSIYEGTGFYHKTLLYSQLINLRFYESVFLGVNRAAENDILSDQLIAFSPDGDTMADDVNLSLALLRHVHDFSAVLTDSEGNVLTEYRADLLKKSLCFNNVLNTVMIPLWDGSADDNDSYIYPEGRYQLDISAYAEGETEKPQTLSFPILIDVTDPSLDRYVIKSVKDKDGNMHKILHVELSDNLGLQSACFYECGIEFEPLFQHIEPLTSAYTGEENGQKATISVDITDVTAPYLYIDIMDCAYNLIVARIPMR